MWNPAALREVEELERVVAALDIRAGRARGAGWLDEGRSVAETVNGLREAGVVRLLVTSIERDGAMQGPDLNLLREVGSLSDMAVIASGGVGDLADLEAVATLECEAAIVGRALYEGPFHSGPGYCRHRRLALRSLATGLEQHHCRRRAGIERVDGARHGNLDL